MYGISENSSLGNSGGRCRVDASGSAQGQGWAWWALVNTVINYWVS